MRILFDTVTSLERAGVGEWPDGTVASHYRFVYALYQEVLYERLAEGRRVQLHRQMAQRLEAGYGERAGEIAGGFALHFEEGRLAPKAIEYHHQAGQAALRRNAPQEAIGHFQTGLGLVAALADTPERRQQELALQMTLSIPLLMTHGYTAPAVEQVYDRAFVLCQQLETPQLFSALHGIRRFHIVRGDLNRGLELGQQLLKIAKDAQDPALLIEAHAHMGGCLVLRGEFAQCRTHEEQCLALFEPHKYDDLGFVYGDDPKALSLAHLARASWYLGYPDEAAQRSQESLTRAQEQTNRMTVVVAHVSASYLRLIRREEQLSRALLDAVRTTATTEGHAMFHMWDTISNGWTFIEHSSLQNGQNRQNGQKGIAQIQDGLATLRHMGVGNHVTTCLLLLATGYLKSGQIRAGLDAVAETFTVMQKSEERESEAELHRLKGELLSKQAQGKRQQAKIAVEIEGCYQKALEIARSQHAKLLELRAAMSLSRWWTEQDRQAEARHVLADVYNWFTEGFGTRDLQEAKAVLSQLGGAPSHRLKKKKTTRRTEGG